MLIEQGDGLCRKAIGKLMTDVKVPAPIRDEIYLLADGDEVIWIPGYRMSGAYKICDDTKNILEIKIDDGGNSNG
jgi:tRNA(Ile)-lysidine synthase